MFNNENIPLRLDHLMDGALSFPNGFCKPHLGILAPRQILGQRGSCFHEPNSSGTIFKVNSLLIEILEA